MKKYLFSMLLSLQLFGSSEELIVGTASGYAPYVSLDAQGRYEGFDIDFAESLAKKLHRKLVIKDCGAMPSLLLSLEQGKVDLVLWAVTITEERNKKMEMVYYQGEKVMEMPFLFWGNAPEGIQTIEDLGKRNFAVSVEAGSWQENVLRKYPEVRLKQVEKITDALMEIRFGKSKAAMADPSLVSELTAQFPKLKVLRLPLKLEDYSLGNGICVKKSNQGLANEIKKATEQLAQDGRVAELEKKWGLGSNGQ
jgi:ABC-type amino acid transport substrate-binding protein